MSEGRNVHLIGVGGAGMSALARILLDRGEVVSGCDLEDSPTTRELARLGLHFQVGHAPAHVEQVRRVVYSSAVPEDAPELLEARRRGIPTLKHAAALGALMDQKRGIAVAGTAGKTTTTAMIAHILVAAGLDPAYEVGGDVVDLGTSARWGLGEWMVAEADEFDRRFLELRPEVAVVTNVEPDHLETYGTFVGVVEAFAEFLRRVPPGGHIVAWGDDPILARLLPDARVRVISYGVAGQRGPQGEVSERHGHSAAPARSPEFGWWAEGVRLTPQGTHLTVCTREGKQRVPAFLLLPGVHNVCNALAAMAAAAVAGVEIARSAEALATFHGTARRFQLAGEARGVRVYEDYAHHPTKVRATLAAARQIHAGRLWAVFQPHLYVRTDTLFDEFIAAFGQADRVLITDVYSPAGRERVEGRRGSAELVAAMRHPDVRHVPSAADALQVLSEEVEEGDLVLVMGAGPINQLAHQLADFLAR